MLIEVQNQYGEQSMGRLRSWQEMIANSASAADIEKLRLANEFINRNQLAHSQDYQDNSNYRATPFEFLILGSGDSEDFAIAKYITLREMGVEASKLRLTYSQSIEDDSYQMILAYYQSPDQEPLPLDNVRKPNQARLRQRRCQASLQPSLKGYFIDSFSHKNGSGDAVQPEQGGI